MSPPILRASCRRTSPPTSPPRSPPTSPSQASQFVGFGTLQRAESLLSPMQKQVSTWTQGSEASQSYQKIQGTLLSPAAASAYRSKLAIATGSAAAPPPRSVDGPRPRSAVAVAAGSRPAPTASSTQGSRFVVPANIAGSLTPEQRTRWSRHWALARRKRSSATAAKGVSPPPSTAPAAAPPSIGTRAGPSRMASLSSTLRRPRLMPLPKPLFKVNKYSFYTHVACRD